MRHNRMTQVRSIFNRAIAIQTSVFTLFFGQFPLDHQALAQAPGQPATKSVTAPPGSSPLGFKVETDPTKNAPAEPPTEAEKFIDASIQKVRALQSISADITQTAEILNQKFELKGQYLKAPNQRIRMQLTLSGLDSATGSMLQVCDGEILWDVQQVLESQSYRKRRIGEILKKVNDPRMDVTLREQILAQLGFAGPESLLVGLRKSIKFESMTDDTLNGKKVVIVQGEWKDRASLVAPGQQPLPTNAPLPAYVPSIVRAWIGKDDGWPYQLRLVGRAPSEINLNQAQLGPDGRPMRRPSAGPKVTPSAMTLSYSNVQLNIPLKPEQFAYTAPPALVGQVADDTEEFLTVLDRILAEAEARQRAAGNGDSSLKQSIPIPKRPVENSAAPAPLTAPGAPATGAAQPAPSAQPKPGGAAKPKS
ncbi:MAG: hypothetical protein WCJ40_07710 [Planctomycetota bacterium]